jgi:hypothetical protein
VIIVKKIVGRCYRLLPASRWARCNTIILRLLGGFLPNAGFRERDRDERALVQRAPARKSTCAAGCHNQGSSVAFQQMSRVPDVSRGAETIA